MTVILTSGDIFDSKTDAYVNAVNCVGVMGAGIARQFKVRYPRMNEDYVGACSRGEVRIGNLHVFDTLDIFPRYIINFPTKYHWKEMSRIESIEFGLEDLKRIMREYDIQTASMPALGAGLGGLLWEPVKKKVIEHFENEKDVKILLFEPHI